MPPSGPRPTARPGAGPGRGKPRPRPASRDRVVPADGADEPTIALDAGATTPPEVSSAKASRGGRAGGPSSRGTAKTRASAARSGSTAPTRRRTAQGAGRAGAGAAVLQRAVRANLTARALALVVVVLVLTISYATSLRIYFSQAHEIASTKAQIADSQATIADLQSQISRWDDPAYVSAQARERLGWLVPGETGYTVVGADGKPLGGGLTLDSSEADQPGQKQATWYDRMWGSVKAADRPAAKKADPGKRAPVSEDSKPR